MSDQNVQTPRNRGGRQRPAQQNRQHLQQVVNTQHRIYQFTKVYTAALDKGFKDRAALNTFTTWVNANIASIDPASIRVCNECGSSDLIPCDHFIVPAAPNAVVVNAHQYFAVPAGPTNFRRRFMWVGGIRRMFTWPSYDASINNNHNLGGFHNSDIDDNMIIDEMYNYIQLNMCTSYLINGSVDRRARLEHCHKLALKYCEEHSLRNPDPTTTHAIQNTIQRACDNAENDMLYERTNPTHNLLNPYALLDGVVNGVKYCLNATARGIVHMRHPIIAGVITVMVFRNARWLQSLTWRFLYAPAGRMVINSALSAMETTRQIMRGSAVHLNNLANWILNVSGAMRTSYCAGSVMQWLNNGRTFATETVSTMSSGVSMDDILSRVRALDAVI
ncbi:hypothetical protein 1 [Changjiang tombus-like virus 19]|uniref:hypothetical protein 1 n=1 Tax=Changjiang tombus-like virus 19 TaxID=1922812 RepID=UPI00090A177D|nr:hypothetical protein 1 [Changjiang tombus-like virus 19]APG76219.1 hypothetical protein 1 [Changjiang tombus-like virus 19]